MVFTRMCEKFIKHDHHVSEVFWPRFVQQEAVIGRMPSGDLDLARTAREGILAPGQKNKRQSNIGNISTFHSDRIVSRRHTRIMEIVY